jgi:hypothetical protein
MHIHSVLTCLLLLFAGATELASAADADRGYRLAGVMVAGDGYLGFLELPQGEQVLVRLGSVVDGGGKVVAFDARSLRIRFPDGVVELSLEGSGKPLVVGAAPQVVVSGDEQGHTIRRTVDVAGLQEGLQDDTGAPNAAKSRAGGPPPDPQRTVTQRFSPLLDLPADARVVAINETPVTSASTAISTVESTLAKGMPARLNLETPEGMKRVYLMPARTPGGTPNTKKR